MAEMMPLGSNHQPRFLVGRQVRSGEAPEPRDRKPDFRAAEHKSGLPRKEPAWQSLQPHRHQVFAARDLATVGEAPQKLWRAWQRRQVKLSICSHVPSLSSGPRLQVNEMPASTTRFSPISAWLSSRRCVGRQTSTAGRAPQHSFAHLRVAVHPSLTKPDDGVDVQLVANSHRQRPRKPGDRC